ncbi:MAG: HlyD family secretion protein [Candidatus Acididesulfobacter guangdongensis]|uniref:HlyD family secretion protein n=1 Tax=Acididesulfobacter guangdongensis TaxID=2597225 RepID=A0A519BGZ2_ACIG2|nr:MAG: HlyD family secretion protein [Candidatus Acididesulfobacter guangdongensis]
MDIKNNDAAKESALNNNGSAEENKTEENKINESKNKNKKSKVKKKYILIVSLIVLAILTIIELPNIKFMFSHVTTSDAFIDGSSAIVPIAPQVKGKVVQVYVRQNQYVTKGQPLFKIDQSDYIQAVNKAGAAFKANKNQINQISISILVQNNLLDKAKYQLIADEALEKLDRENYIRYYNLLKGNATSKLLYDEMLTKYKMIKAKVNADKANINQIASSISESESAEKSKTFMSKTAMASYKIAEINLKRTVVYAPCSGYIAKKNVNVGSYVMPGIPYLNVVNLHKIWVVANFKESDINNIKIGAPVIIKVDAYPNQTFHGVVSSFQSGTGSVFSLLPPENATGNYIKVVQRVPVKIDLTKVFYTSTPLYPGLSVEPYVLIVKK